MNYDTCSFIGSESPEGELCTRLVGELAMPKQRIGDVTVPQSLYNVVSFYTCWDSRTLILRTIYCVDIGSLDSQQHTVFLH